MPTHTHCYGSTANSIQSSKSESKMEIQKQIVEMQRERKDYYPTKPIDIDLTR